MALLDAEGMTRRLPCRSCPKPDGCASFHGGGARIHAPAPSSCAGQRVHFRRLNAIALTASPLRTKAVGFARVAARTVASALPTITRAKAGAARGPAQTRRSLSDHPAPRHLAGPACAGRVCKSLTPTPAHSWPQDLRYLEAPRRPQGYAAQRRVLLERQSKLVLSIVTPMLKFGMDCRDPGRLHRGLVSLNLVWPDVATMRPVTDLSPMAKATRVQLPWTVKVDASARLRVSSAFSDAEVCGDAVAHRELDHVADDEVPGGHGQKEVWFFTKIISTIVLGLFTLALIIWAAWLRRSFPGYESASQAIGLPVCVALSLTIAAKHMAKRNVLVKNLATIQTLGCMSVLCSDKTGRLTVGKMSVQNVAFLDAELNVEEIQERFPGKKATSAPLALLWHFEPFTWSHIKGDATDSAFLCFAEGLSVPSIDEQTDAHVVQWYGDGHAKLGSKREPELDRWMLVKGGPDILFPKCSSVMRADGCVSPLHASLRAELHLLQERWSSEGQGVLTPRRSLDGLMHRTMGDLTLVGLVGIRDQPRHDVADGVRTIRRARVRVFMVTGDFKPTVLAIACQGHFHHTGESGRPHGRRSPLLATRYVGLDPPEIKPSEDDAVSALVLTGDDIELLKAVDWNVVLGGSTEIVFARTTPEQKSRPQCTHLREPAPSMQMRASGRCKDIVDSPRCVVANYAGSGPLSDRTAYTDARHANGMVEHAMHNLYAHMMLMTSTRACWHLT
ncbi:hypothetical protein LXA43DRAFT_1178693 [Ganoderma leucocontextum]|nr:hypothetical protein LXA43DRAFT_1178693 [Ganoderma leucocontextum]